jgi:hypothetical protein
MAKKKTDVEDDKCQRCGDDGGDMRTLYMACFYAMEELGLPFEDAVYFDASTKDLRKASAPLSVDLGAGKKINLSAGTVRCDGELTPKRFYTLRVCKECRADWMTAISTWFNDRKSNGCGSGIFVRRNGASVEITEDEWYQLNPGREPVRIRQ